MANDTINKSNNGLLRETLGDTGPYEQLIEKGEARQIDLAEIEKGITQLWQEAGKSRQNDDKPAVMRACVLNLIIFTGSDEELDEATHCIAHITWAYPCRAIILLSKPDAPENSMNAWISAHCQIVDTKGTKVCCEQITIEGQGTSSGHMGSMVLPLLVADLPVVFWWIGNPTMEGLLFERLIDTVDKFILDSLSFKKPLDSFKQLNELVQAHSGVFFSDLNWSRLNSWRNLIANIFDLPAVFPYLFLINRIEIEFEAPEISEVTTCPPNFSQALLLVAWLANALGWQPAFSLKTKDLNGTLILNNHDQPLNIDIIGRNEHKGVQGSITSVKLFSSKPDENREVIVIMPVSEDYEHITYIIQENGEITTERTVMMVKRDMTALLQEELGMVDKDPYYEKALNFAAQLAGS